MVVPNPMDQAARYAAKRLDPEGFLRWILPEVFAAWRWSAWVDTQAVPFPGEPDRRCDTVAEFTRLAGDAPPVATVVEFQTRPQPGMLERVVDYGGDIRRELPAQTQPRVPYDVIGVVLNLTGPEQPETWEMSPPDFAGLGSSHRCRVLAVAQRHAAATLADIATGRLALCILPWIALMRGADRPEVVEEWKRLAATETEPRRRGDYAGLALIFAELAECETVWNTALEGWNMETSKVVAGWEARGETRGVVKDSRAKLLKVLKSRLGAEPSAEVVAAVNAQSDAAMLDQWFDLALSPATVEEVHAAILRRA